MKKSRAIYIEIIFFFLFVMINVFIVPLTTSQWKQLRNCNIYDGNWCISTPTESTYCDSLPTFYHTTDNGKDIWISKTLTNIADGDCVGFFSFQQQIDVLLDDEIIYSFAPSPHQKSQTPGNKWNFLPVNASDTGKTLTIHIHECYIKGRVTIPTIYYGTQVGITLNYLSSVNPRIYISIATILVGCLLGIFHVLKRHRISMNDSVKWLALFAIFRGLWSYIESNTYSFFLPELLLVSQVSYMCLKVAVVVYIEFLNQTFHNGNNKTLHVLRICSVGDFFLTFLLQYFGITDFANTVFITHSILLFGGIYACTIIIRTFYQNSSGNTLRKRYSYFGRLACTLIIIFTSIIDLIRYYATNSPDVAQYSRIGDFLYVVLMSFSLFLDFVYLLRMGQHAEIIREEASLDSMTKLKNRAQFEKDIAKVNPRQWKNYSIILLDLNNLKQFNDSIGHDAGDQYIITAGNIIRDVFSSYGTIYRIGGDEFCIIAKKLDLQKFVILRTTLENNFSIRNHRSDIPMAIAAGYACFDAKLDKNLQDTMKRADAKMYNRKQELKEENGKS